MILNIVYGMHKENTRWISKTYQYVSIYEFLLSLRGQTLGHEFTLFQYVIDISGTRRNFFHKVRVDQAVTDRTVNAPAGVNSIIAVHVAEDAKVDLGEVLEEGVDQPTLGGCSAAGGGR